MSERGVSLAGFVKENIDRMIINKFLKVPVLTTAERNKLKAEKGLVVFNSSLGKLQINDGTDWVSVH